jgi:hypothetical protein
VTPKSLEEFLSLPVGDPVGAAALRGAIQAHEAMDRVTAQLRREACPHLRERLRHLLCQDAERLAAYLSILHRRGLS